MLEDILNRASLDYTDTLQSTNVPLRFWYQPFRDHNFKKRLAQLHKFLWLRFQPDPNPYLPYISFTINELSSKALKIFHDLEWYVEYLQPLFFISN